MRNLKGGYIILSLVSMALAETSETTSITDEEVLKQLLSLSDYALKPDKELKPIYLRAKDTSGIEVVSLCELDRNAGSLRIKAKILDYILQIYVAYDVDADTGEVSIDTCGYDFIEESEKIVEDVKESIEDGSIVETIGLSGSGELVKQVVGSGTKLYVHKLSAGGLADQGPSFIISTYASSYANKKFSEIYVDSVSPNSQIQTTLIGIILMYVGYQGGSKLALSISSSLISMEGSTSITFDYDDDVICTNDTVTPL